MYNYKCIECDEDGVWIRRTQFAGSHVFCKKCAEKEKDFLDNSQDSWVKIT